MSMQNTSAPTNVPGTQFPLPEDWANMLKSIATLHDLVKTLQEKIVDHESRLSTAPNSNRTNAFKFEAEVHTGNFQPDVVWGDFNFKARQYGHTSTINGPRKKTVETTIISAWRLQYLHTEGSTGTGHAFYRRTTVASFQTYLFADHAPTPPSNAVIHSEIVLEAMLRYPNKGPGPDGIHILLLKVTLERSTETPRPDSDSPLISILTEAFSALLMV
ncbi:hypothetical protein SARC_01214 [Sphaeroforma arctica JP610]|uniref:Uncharacterized protein n=1 Tax=Sphaeroforma arctica JP610 TaxID=667725 RepID=A0A0L0GCK5_9EUKA|nr:hypothetical protein SARC_01214 [Sphaeroforma arctica JP610]KNC86634.1 hypothetical protein SARC_01214 [Sphaeroforma arctica JP610]|eukprot:XP_014160536.1 hypothetical protein SARC_01214 [Sphaeroforma arctica JP610]